jgi:hypothetical protein
MSHGSHVTTISFFHDFQLDNHHLSLQDRPVISLVSSPYSAFVRYRHQFSIKNLFEICHPQISISLVYFSDLFYIGTIFHKHDIFLLIIVWINKNGLPHGLTTLPYPRPFFLQFHLHTNKHIVSYHAHTFPFHTCSGFQKISKLFILTVKSHLSIQLYKVKGNISFLRHASLHHSRLFQIQFKHQINSINVPMSMATFTRNAPLN